MAMTEKQKYRRLDEAWESHYGNYSSEAEWYGINDDNIWICDIPSKQIMVKLELKEEYKDVCVFIAPMEKQSGYNYIRETEWQLVGHYSW